MSNVWLVAEYWFTQAYLQEAREARDALPAGTIQEDGKNTWLNDTVWMAADAIENELYARARAVESGYGEGYEAAMASNTTILRQWSNKYADFSTPLADPGTPGNPTVKSVGGFGDVLENQFFAQPVVWAVENGITSGTGEGRFSPYSRCTQGQIITFLWRAAGSPEPESEPLKYFDKNAYYYKAVQWAAEQGVTSGVGDNKFAPDELCNRAQIVTFLYRAFAN